MKAYRLNRIRTVFLLVVLSFVVLPAYARPPKVIETEPENGQRNVDPELREIRIVFDQDMGTGGYSICGGGPKFPKTVGKPRWVDKRTLVMRVRLVANHDYQLSVNCPSAKNCRSVNGEPARRYPLRFRTGSDGTGGSTVAEGAPPKVIEMVPENGARNVNPNLQEIRVVFDQDMTTGRNFSICGGGPKFPNIIGDPQWIDSRTIVLKVELQPRHEYRFSINCPSAGNFRSVSGISAKPYPISFTTADGSVKERAKPLTVSDNIKAVSRLRRVIDEHYSYRDLRAVDWDKLFSENYETLKAAKAPEDFAAVAAELLASAKDKHIWLYAGPRRFAAYVKPVTANANFSRLKNLIPQWQKRSAVVFTGRFEDGIGYILLRVQLP